MDQFIVPVLTETSDKGFAEILIQGNSTFPAFGYSTVANVPTVVVDGLKLAILVNTERVEVAADWLWPINLSIEVSLFDGAVGGAVVTPCHVGAFAVIDQRGAGLGGVV